jgi:hypothetical protein
MKARFLLISVLASSPAFALNFGTVPATAKPTAVKPASTTAAPAATLQFSNTLRIVKPDGATILQQAAIVPQGGAMNALTVSAADAFLTSGGKCAFNLRYDEVASAALTATTNRLYSNDTLVAQNTKIDLAAGTPRSLWTQAYLTAGQNNLKLVLNADSTAPVVGWVRINVNGKCDGSATSAPPSTAKPPAPPASSASSPTTGGDKPTTPAPVPSFKPGSAEWNNLNTAWGYSNYGTTQLKGKGYARYDDLVKLNQDLTTVINAKVVDQTSYNALMARWNSFVTEAAFKAAMAAITPAPTGSEKPPTATIPPVTPPPTPAPVSFKPGSSEWNNLNNAWGYSNYATTQLKGKGYARYADLVKLNQDLTTVVNAKVVDQAAYNSLMTRWNGFVNEAAFKAAMAAITPPPPGKA